jgi:F0F1-type ATP synthase assembly protein I
MVPPARKKPQHEAIRTAGLLLAIPALLVASPLVGLFAGMALDRWLGTGRVLTAVGIVLGFAAAGRETYRIYRRVQAEEEQRGKRP